MTTNYMSNYSYGPDCFKEIPEVLDKYKVHKVVFIGGEKALKSSQADVKSVLENNGFAVTGSFVYGKDATQANIDRLVATPEVQDADIVFGFGGGRALDTVKMVAMALDKTIFTFPTICSNCSAGTGISVLYKEDGSFDRYGYPDVPAHVFINTSVIAKAPKEYLGIHFLVWIEIPCQIFLYKKEDICCPLVIQSIHHKNHERRLNKCPIMILS